MLQSLNQYDLLILDQAERFSLQYLGNLCMLLSRCRCAVLLVGQNAFWERVSDVGQDESFWKLVEDMQELDENDVWDCWEHGIV
jgi:hypothetical protein